MCQGRDGSQRGEISTSAVGFDRSMPTQCSHELVAITADAVPPSASAGLPCTDVIRARASIEAGQPSSEPLHPQPGTMLPS